MRRITEEERALFLAALSGRLPAKKPRPRAETRSAVSKTIMHAKKTAAKTAEPRRRGRHVTPEEEELFLSVVFDQVPAKEPLPKPKIASTATPVVKTPKTARGLDGNTLRKLTRGELAPTAKLDLHGMTEAAAHGALTAFVLSAHRRGDRLVLVVTGKGNPEGPSGVLKRNVPRWLDEAPMAKIIAEKRWAHRRHGGEGALYVYLRKR